MPLTKKDFNAIASSINQQTRLIWFRREAARKRSDFSSIRDYDLRIDGMLRAIQATAQGLAETNPRFRREKFLEACWADTPIAGEEEE